MVAGTMCCQVLWQRYWIPSASVAIRKFLAKCVICRRLHGAAGQQQMVPIDKFSADEPPLLCWG